MPLLSAPPVSMLLSTSPVLALKTRRLPCVSPANRRPLLVGTSPACTCDSAWYCHCTRPLLPSIAVIQPRGASSFAAEAVFDLRATDAGEIGRPEVRALRV